MKKCQKWLKHAKKCQNVKKAKEYNNRKIPESTTLYLLKRKYMLKKFKTSTNCPKLQDPGMSKSAKKCYNIHHNKVPKSTKRCQKASYISLYETTMSSTCHIFGQIDYNGGSPV